jgi:hypothetical protein|tara:strand:+ start:810 stop:1751 length:942 start_codon:yes stop_codon:yes gene_type:complete
MKNKNLGENRDTRYVIGSGWTNNFDYDGMLQAGLQSEVDSPLDQLKAMAKDYEDVNYHREVSHLFDAIEAIEDGEIDGANDYFDNFHSEIMKTAHSQNMDIESDLGSFMKNRMGLEEEVESMDEVRIDRDVAERIEGMFSISLKEKFLDTFEDLYVDLIEEDPFYAEDVINHLNNEMHRRIREITRINKQRSIDEPNEIPMFKGTRDALDDISIREDSTTEEIDYKLDPYEDRDKILKQVMSLLVREKGASREEFKGFIKTHMEDILNAEDDDAIVDEFTQYLSVNEGDSIDESREEYIANKALREHFKRFLK